jgi:hypothetical protein
MRFHAFFISTLHGVFWLVSELYHRERALGAHRIRGCIGARAGIDAADTEDAVQ